MPDGSCCQSRQLTTTNICCPRGQSPGGPNNSQCQQSSGGWTPLPSGGVTPVGQTPRREFPGGGGSGNQPIGQTPRGRFPGDPRYQCCAPGTIPLADGSCCPPARKTAAGVCCSWGQIQDPKNPGLCMIILQGIPTRRIPSCSLERGQITTADGNCCQINLLTSNGKCCADGTVVSNDGTSCVPPPGPNRPMVAPPCGPNTVSDRFGNCGPLIQGEPDRPILLPPTLPNACDGPNMVRDRSGSCVPLVKDRGNISAQTPSTSCGPNKVRNRNGRCVPLTKAGTAKRGDTNIGHAKGRTRTKAETKTNETNSNIGHAIGDAVIQNILRGATKGRGAPSVPQIKTPSGNNPINPNNPGFGR
jgi:hypothetical protein